MEDTQEEGGEGGRPITLVTNLHRLLAGASTSSWPPSTHSTTSSTSSSASTLVTYRLYICEHGRAQVDLPMAARR